MKLTKQPRHFVFRNTLHAAGWALLVLGSLTAGLYLLPALDRVISAFFPGAK